MTYIRPGFVVVIVGATLTSMSTVIVAMRLYCRHFLVGSVTASDHLMLTALFITWGNFIINYYQDKTSKESNAGDFGIPEKRPQAEESIRGILITWWLYRFTYVIALCFAKLSILFFYRDIVLKRIYRPLVIVTMTFVSLYSFAVAVAMIFQCDNPQDTWSIAHLLSQFDRNTEAKKEKFSCFDPTKLLLFGGAANLLTDVVILVLPIPALLSLRVPVSKRLALIGIFSIGSIAIVASSVRMWVMTLWAESPANSARYGADLLLWGQVETNAGIISASVPFLRLLSTGRDKEKGTENLPRMVDRGSPMPAFSQTRAIHLRTWDPEKGECNPTWGPFATVPKNVSSGGRSSASVEQVRPHSTA